MQASATIVYNERDVIGADTRRGEGSSKRKKQAGCFVTFDSVWSAHFVLTFIVVTVGGGHSDACFQNVPDIEKRGLTKLACLISVSEHEFQSCARAILRDPIREF